MPNIRTESPMTPDAGREAELTSVVACEGHRKAITTRNHSRPPRISIDRSNERCRNCRRRGVKERWFRGRDSLRGSVSSLASLPSRSSLAMSRERRLASPRGDPVAFLRYEGSDRAVLRDPSSIYLATRLQSRTCARRSPACLSVWYRIRQLVTGRDNRTAVPVEGPPIRDP